MLADLPGLIEGAHDGAGLGHRFLGHAERCRVLVHLVDGTQDDVASAYRTIRKELSAYSEVLAAKPEILCLNTADALAPDEIAAKRAKLARAAKLKKGRAKNAPDPVPAISGATGAGVRELLERVLAILADSRSEAHSRTDAHQPGQASA